MSEDFPQDSQQVPSPQATLVEEAQKPEYLQRLQSVEAQFEAEVPRHTVLDDERFERTVYDLGDGVSMVFRGREELPTFGATDGEVDVTRAVVGIEEKPQHTSGDRYGTWTMAITKGEPYDDVFERAAKAGSSRIELVASSSALGVVEAARALADMGKGDPSVIPQLESLKKSLVDGAITDEVLKLYDDIFIASTVDTVSDNLLGSIANPGDAGRVDTHAPMQVALALVGDPTAQDLLKAKEEKVSTLEVLEEQRRRESEGRTEEDAAIKQPRQRLNDEELEVIKEAHLVAVHTSTTNPAKLADGLRVMRPAAEFDKKNPNKSSRSTMHWSLNHAVESHFAGNFAGREYTVIVPMEDMARINGAPAVLHGVDTYFTSNPGEGLLVPQQAVIIHAHQEANGPVVRKEGDEIELKTGEYRPEDIDQIIDFLANDYYMRYKDQGWSESTARYVAQKFVEESLTTDVHSSFQELGKLRLTDEAKATMLPHEFEVSSYSRAIFRALQQQGINPESFADRHAAGEDIYDEFAQAAQEAVQAVIADERIADYPELHPVLGEALRVKLVNDTIQGMGGRVVQSDGMSSHIETKGFTDTVNSVVRKVGLRTGLHARQPEAAAEEVIDTQLQEAITTLRVPSDLEHPDRIREARADFDWTKFDGQPIWRVMSGSRTPWAVRRQLIDRGLLTYDTQAPDPARESFVF